MNGGRTPRKLVTDSPTKPINTMQEKDRTAAIGLNTGRGALVGARARLRLVAMLRRWRSQVELRPRCGLARLRLDSGRAYREQVMPGHDFARCGAPWCAANMRGERRTDRPKRERVATPSGGIDKPDEHDN